jgi:hypothetical protein
VKASAASIIDGQAVEVVKPEAPAGLKSEGKAPKGTKP